MIHQNVGLFEPTWVLGVDIQLKTKVEVIERLLQGVFQALLISPILRQIW